jgi:hypothetical protein
LMGRRGRDSMEVWFITLPVQSVPITTKVRITFVAICTRYNIM